MANIMSIPFQGDDTLHNYNDRLKSHDRLNSDNHDNEHLNLYNCSKITSRIACNAQSVTAFFPRAVCLVQRLKLLGKWKIAGSNSYLAV